MPPWGAVKGFAAYRDDDSLTQEEVNVLAEWVEGGSPEGDRCDLPEFTWDKGAAAPVPEVHGEITVTKKVTRLKRPHWIVGIRPRTLRHDAALLVIAGARMGASNR